MNGRAAFRARGRFASPNGPAPVCAADPFASGRLRDPPPRREERVRRAASALRRPAEYIPTLSRKAARR